MLLVVSDGYHYFLPNVVVYCWIFFSLIEKQHLYSTVQFVKSKINIYNTIKDLMLDIYSSIACVRIFWVTYEL